MLYYRGSALALSLPDVRANRHREYEGGGAECGSAGKTEPVLPFETCRPMHLVYDACGCTPYSPQWLTR
jgi:hypothetical protein